MATTVEFFGVPGAGKTHLALDIRRRLLDDQMIVAEYEGWSRAWKVRAIVRYRRAILASVVAFVKGPRRSRDLAQVLRFLITTLERHYRASKDPSDTVYLIDEGVVQRLFMLLVGESAMGISVSDRFLSYFPVADRYVHVAVVPELAEERLAHRERGLPDRFTGMHGPRWRSLAAQADAAMTATGVRLAENGRPGSCRARRVLLNASSDLAADVYSTLDLEGREEPGPSGTVVVDLGSSLGQESRG